MSSNTTSNEVILYDHINRVTSEYTGVTSGKVLTIIEAAMEPGERLNAVKSLVSSAIYDTHSIALDEVCAILASLVDHKGEREEFNRFWGYRATRHGEYVIDWPSTARRSNPTPPDDSGPLVSLAQREPVT